MARVRRRVVSPRCCSANDRIPGAIKRFEDNAWGMKRIEIVCAKCGGHLVRPYYKERRLLILRDMCSKEKDLDMRMAIRSMNDIVSIASRSNSTTTKKQSKQSRRRYVVDIPPNLYPRSHYCPIIRGSWSLDPLMTT